MTTKLDTREARCDLTSRECSKLLCGALAGAIGAGVEIGTLQKLIRIINLVQYEDPESRPGYSVELLGLMKEIQGYDSVVAGTSAKVMMLGAMIGAITEQAADGSMRDACRWILEQREEFWQAMSERMVAVAKAAAGQSD
jgi:hypothetical protein